MTDGVIDGCERRPMRVEHLLEGFHQILEQVKPISDLDGLWRSLARPISIGSGSVARDDLYPGWARSHCAKVSASRSGSRAIACRRSRSIRTVP